WRALRRQYWSVRGRETKWRLLRFGVVLPTPCTALSALWGCACRRLRGRARLLDTVTAQGVDVLDAHIAALLGARRTVPFIRCCPPSVRPRRITGVDVRVDIGLCIGRHHPGG